MLTMPFKIKVLKTKKNYSFGKTLIPSILTRDTFYFSVTAHSMINVVLYNSDTTLNISNVQNLTMNYVCFDIHKQVVIRDQTKTAVCNP